MLCNIKKFNLKELSSQTIFLLQIQWKEYQKDRKKWRFPLL